MNKRQAVRLTAYVSAGFSLLVWIAVAVLFFTRPSPTESVAASPKSDPAPATVASVQSPAPLREAREVRAETPPRATERSRDLLLEEKFPYLDLPDIFVNAAFDSVTREILVVGGHQKHLAVYGADQLGYQSAQPKLIPLDGMPTAVGVKLLDAQRSYVVTTIDPNLLVMIDAESHEIIRQVNLQSPQLKIWDNLNDDDPGILMAPFKESDLSDYNRRDGQVNQFTYYGAANAVEYDLRAMNEGPTLQGKIVSVNSQGPKKKVLFMPLKSSYTSLHLAEIDAGGKLNVQSSRRPWPLKLVPRICGDVVAMGRRVTTHDLNEEIGIADFYPKAQMPNTDLIAGNYGRTFRIASMSPLESLFEYDVPDEWEMREDTASSTAKIREIEVFADTTAMQFIVVLPNKLLALPLATAGIEQRASLQLVLDGETSIFAGQRLELNVQGRPEIKQLSLVSAPDGLTLDDNKLVWTPSNAQSGIHTCKLSHRDGDREHVQSWPIMVRRRGFDLPVKVREFDVVSDGKLGVFSGLNPDREDTEWRSALTFVDMEELTIRKRVKLGDTASVRCGERVILVSNVQGVTIYDRKTLETIPNPPRLKVGAWSDLTLGDLQELEAILLAEPRSEQVTDRDLVDHDGTNGPTAFGHFVKGVLRDASTDQPLLLGSHSWLRKWRRRSRWRPPFAPMIGNWHPYRNNMTRFRSSRELGIVGSHWSSPDRFAVKLVDDKLVLQIFSLDGEQPLGEALLSETGSLEGTTARKPLDPPGETRPYVQSNASLFVGPKRVFVTYQSRLFVVERSEFPTPDPPFHIVPRQSVFELPMASSVEVEYEAVGASTFQMTVNRQSKLTSNNGRFRLNMDEITPQLIEAYIGEAGYVFPNRDRRQNLAEAFALSRQGYKEIFGRETTDVPLHLQIQLVAQSEDLKKAYLGHDFLVLVPEETVINALEQQKK